MQEEGFLAVKPPAIAHDDRAVFSNDHSRSKTFYAERTHDRDRIGPERGCQRKRLQSPNPGCHFSTVTGRRAAYFLRREDKSTQHTVSTGGMCFGVRSTKK